MDWATLVANSSTPYASPFIPRFSDIPVAAAEIRADGGHQGGFGDAEVEGQCGGGRPDEVTLTTTAVTAPASAMVSVILSSSSRWRSMSLSP